MVTSVCQNCGEMMYRSGGGRPAKLCPKCRGKHYGPEHRKLRRDTLENAYGTNCARCGQVMLRGQQLDLDHADYGGPDEYMPGLYSHAKCNSAAGGRINRASLEAKGVKAERWTGAHLRKALMEGPPPGPAEGPHNSGCTCYHPYHGVQSWWPRRCW